MNYCLREPKKYELDQGFAIYRLSTDCFVQVICQSREDSFVATSDFVGRM